MALTTIGYVADCMRTKDYPFWRVKCDGQLVNMYEDKAKDVELSISQLMKCVDSQIGGLLEITISNKTGVEKNADGGNPVLHTLKFFVEANKKPIGAIADNGSSTELNKLYEQLAHQKYVNEIEQLKKEIAELKEELEEEIDEEPQTAIGAILDEVRPYIKPLISKFLGQTLPLQQPNPIADNVSSTNDASTTKATPEQIEQIKKCSAGAMRILKLDEYFGERVLQLAILAEKDKASYDMACNMLNTMAQKLA